MTNEEIVKKCKKKLKTKTEWIDRYFDYSTRILNNQGKLKNAREQFHSIKPLYIYSGISKAKDSKSTVEYDLRFCGQSVATLTVKDDEVYITTKDNNENYFTLSDGQKPKELKDDLWTSDKARDFKNFFINHEKVLQTKIASPEHKLESKLLIGFDNEISHIKPVEIAKAFFQMPTPFKASEKDNVYYSGSYGGGIDILARIEHGSNKDNRLAVMELKDENKSSEPQKDVIQQALKYATFIAYLLRSKSGDNWYKLFEKDKGVPDNLKIDVVSVMPKGSEDIIEDNEIIDIDENTHLHLYSLFFDPDDENFNFSGTLASVLNE